MSSAFIKQVGSSVHTRWVGYTGLAVGGASIIASVRSLFALLSSPMFIEQLYEASKTHHDPTGSIARLVAAFFGILGAFTIALLATYLGRSAFAPDKETP